MNKVFLLVYLTALQTFLASSQNDNHKSAGIYYIHIEFDEDLTNSFCIPEYKIERIKSTIEKRCSSRFNCTAECIYKITRKGKPYKSLGVFGKLYGMPENSLKNSIKNNEKDLFIVIYIKVSNDGENYLIADNGKSNLKPQLSGVIRVYTPDKKKIYKKKIHCDNLKSILHLKYKDKKLAIDQRISIINSAVNRLTVKPI